MFLLDYSAAAASRDWRIVVIKHHWNTLTTNHQKLVSKLLRHAFQVNAFIFSMQTFLKWFQILTAFENGTTTTIRSNLQWTFFGRYRNLADAAGGGFHLCIHVMAVSNAVIPSLVDHQRTGVETTAKLSFDNTLDPHDTAAILTRVVIVLHCSIRIDLTDLVLQMLSREQGWLFSWWVLTVDTMITR